MIAIIAVCHKPREHVCGKIRAKRNTDENVPPKRKRRGKEKRVHLLKNANKEATRQRPETSPDISSKRRKLKRKQQSSTERKEILGLPVDNEKRSSVNSTQTEKYFPFRVLDESWLQIPVDTPHLGLWKPSCHDETFPRFCSNGLTETQVVPSANRLCFINSEGYWRFMLVGLNRRTIIDAIFMPEASQKTDDIFGEPDNGTFLSALATGKFAGWFPIEALLNCAEEELKRRRLLFVLDIYSHGEEKVEVVINRAY